MLKYQQYELYSFAGIVIPCGMGIFRNLWQLKRDRSHTENGWTYKGSERGWILFLKILTIVGFLVANGYSWWRIITLKKWVGDSGCMKAGRTPNDEDD